MKREASLIKNTIILSIGNVFPKLVSVFSLPILTAYLSKIEYGYYDLITTAVSLFLPIVTLQIQAAAFRYLIDCREKEQEKKHIVTNILLFVMITSFIALVILFVSLHEFQFFTRVAICSYFFVDIILIVTRQIVRGLGKNKVYANSVVVESFVYITSVVIFILVLNLQLEGALCALVMGLLITEIYLIYKIKLFKLIDFRLLDKKIIIELIQYSWPMIPNSLSNWVMKLSDRWVITAFLGVEATAIYAVATKLPTLYGRLQSTFTLAWQENASIAIKDDDAELYYSNLFDTMYCIFFAIMAMLIAATPILFPILINGDYEMAYGQISILYIGSFFSSISAYLGGIYVAYKETKKVGLTTMLAAIINLGVDLALINIIGIYAGAISTLVSYAVLALYRMYDIQKIQKIDFQIKKMGIMLCLLCLMAFLSYQRIMILDMVNFIIAVVLSIYFNRAIIKQLLEKFIIKKV